MAEKTEQHMPPYVPFKTFIGFIDALHTNALPPAIDKTMMVRMSGATQSHLMVAMRFLGLIDADGKVREKLRDLVKSRNTEDWKHVMNNVVTDAYAPIVADVDRASGTIGQLQEAFQEKAGITQQVREKAIRFYLAALDEAGITYSIYFSQRGARAGGRTRSNGQPSAKRSTPRGKQQVTPGNTVIETTPTTPDGFVEHPFQLRRDLKVTLTLPDDFSTADAERLYKFLLLIPIAEE